MMSTYQETPIFEESPVQERAEQALSCNKGRALVGIGIFILMAQVLPANLFFPLFLMGLGGYFLRQQKEARREEKKFGKGHFLVGFGAFILVAQIVPENLLFPLLLIGAGFYVLRKQEKATAE
jgi:preprotein translocase subunit YajC